MARIYDWACDSDGQHTRDVFDALDRVNDLSTLTDVLVVVRSSDMAVRDDDTLVRTGTGEVRTASEGLLVVDAQGVPADRLLVLRFTVGG